MEPKFICLATKETEETVLVCGKDEGHMGDHLDEVDGVSWPNDWPKGDKQREEREIDQAA